MLTIIDMQQKEHKKFGPDDWFEPTEQTEAYTKSKVLAEKLAWSFVEALPAEEKFELVTIVPGFIVGPLIHGDGCSSQQLITSIVTGLIPGYYPLTFQIVDVRDVAKSHLLALTAPANKRYICSSGSYQAATMGKIITDHFGKFGYPIPPVPEVIAPPAYEVDYSRTIQELKVAFRPLESSLVDMVYSLIRLGYIEDKTKA